MLSIQVLYKHQVMFPYKLKFLRRIKNYKFLFLTLVFNNETSDLVCVREAMCHHLLNTCSNQPYLSFPDQLARVRAFTGSWSQLTLRGGGLSNSRTGLLLSSILISDSTTFCTGTENKSSRLRICNSTFCQQCTNHKMKNQRPVVFHF